MKILTLCVLLSSLVCVDVLRAGNNEDIHHSYLLDFLVAQLFVSSLNVMETIQEMFPHESNTYSIQDTLNSIAPENLEDLAMHFVISQQAQSVPSVESFGQALLEAGNDIVASDSLAWVSSHASSTYGAWRFLVSEWDEIYNAWCWELLLILLYESGVSTDREAHTAVIRAMVANWSNAELYPQLSIDEPQQFQAGDLIFMNGSQHIVIATGTDDEVFSLWNRPRNGVIKIKLSTLINDYWPFLPEKPRVHRVSVEQIYAFILASSHSNKF